MDTQFMKILHITNWYPSESQPKRALWIKDQIELLRGEVDYQVWHLEVVSGRLNLQYKKLSTTEHSLTLSFPTQRWFIIELLTTILLVYFFLVKIRLRDFSHLHFHIAYPLLTYWHWLRKVIRKPVVISEHWSAYHFNFNIKDRSKLKPIQRIFHNTLHLITVSQSLAKDIVRFSGNEQLSFSVIHNVVDRQIFHYQEKSILQNTFFMVSQWKEPKDPFTVLKLLKEMPDLYLRIGGYGPQLHEMKLLVERMEVNDRVEFLGTLSKQSIAEEMNQCVAFVHPSSYETFSVVCAEAISCGCPVIASKVGGIPEFVNESNGLLIEDNTEANWKNAFESFQKCSFTREGVAKKGEWLTDMKLKNSQLIKVYKDCNK
jgi:glycosyltransferase involved in cell wall biosynthesis